MKKIVFIQLVSFATTILHAQKLQFKWAKQMVGNFSGYGCSITTDASGNVYTTGTFTGTVDFDPGPGTFYLSTNIGFGSSEDMFVSKINAAGNLVWAKRMGGNGFYTKGNSIAVDAQGNVYTTGSFYGGGSYGGGTDFDPGAGVFKLNAANSGEDVFVSKLDACGNFVWAKQIGGPINSHTVGSSIAVDNSGNSYITGKFYGAGVDFDPGPGVFILNSNYNVGKIFVSKLDVNGGFVWARQMVAIVDGADIFGSYGNSISVDPSGNVFTTGCFGGTVDFDPGPSDYYLSTIYENHFISKLDASGNFIWAKKAEQNFKSFVWSNSIKSDNFGNIYTSGIFYGTVDFDPGPGVVNLSTKSVSSGDFNIYISKFNNSGNLVWVKQIGGIGFFDHYTGSLASNRSSISLDVADNVYLTGAFAGTLDFDPGVDVFEQTAIGNQDIFVLELDAAGNFVWANHLGGTGEIFASSIALDVTGNVYTTGAFKGGIDFDPELSVYNLNAVSYGDIFVHKISRCTNNNSNATITVSACSSYTFNCHNYTSSGVYTEILLNAAGCDSIITLNLTISNKIVTSTVTAAACNSINWNGHTITASGIYTDTLRTANGCDSIVTLNLTIHKNTRSVVSVAACRSYNWNGQTIFSSGIYTDTLVAVNGCDSIATLNLTISPKLFSTITQSICTGQTYLGYSKSGTYNDTLVAGNGCDSIRTLQLTVLQKPVPDLGVDKDVCPGDSIILYPGQYNTYMWQNGSGQSHLTITQPGLYTVTVTDNCGSAKDEIFIKEGFCDVYFPSAFTPNNDGKNDLFKIPNAYQIKDFHLVVYSRWGQKVFETTDPSKGWSGETNGKLPNTGAFTWYCEFRKPGTVDPVKMKGTVMLIR